jgi:hypothetical protein
MKKPEKAKEVFDDAYALYNLFFAIRLKLVDIGDIKNKKEGPWSENDIVAKLVDCCRE